MSPLRVRALLGALCVLLIGGTSDTPQTQYADAFMSLVRGHRFEEAAKMFFYPPSYARQRLAREEATVGAFLESLFKVAGDVRDQTREAPQGSNTWWTLGISGTDGPVGPSDIGADSSELVYYQGRYTNEGRALVALFLVHVRGNWQIMRFDFNLPRSADQGSDHFAEFSRKVFSGCGACQPGKQT